MQIRVFTFSAFDSSLESLNAFLRSQKIINVEQHFFQSDSQPYWSFCVTFFPQNQGQQGFGGGRPKVDYKNILSETDFASFEVLRKVRRQLAETEGVVPYVVFTNAELAEIVTGKVNSLEEMLKIQGIGKAKAEKYGSALLSLWKEWIEPETKTKESEG